MNDVVIIGGGVAGLSAAIHCAQMGKQVLVIEGGDYSTQKVCGEFISPEGLSILKSWNIEPPVLLAQHTVFSERQRLTLKFPEPAGSMPRYDLEHALIAYAQRLGVIIKTKTFVRAIQSHQDGDAYQVTLETGDVITAAHLIISTGRVAQMLDPQQDAPTICPYVGMRAHFKASMPNEVQFFVFQGAYFGVSPVADGIVNIACLAQKELFDRAGSASQFMHELTQFSHAHVIQKIIQEPLFDWVTCKVPEFGVRKFCGTGQSYLIGDASMVVPPCTGMGLSLALLSGRVVATAIKTGDRKFFDGVWKKESSGIITWGKRLHVLLINQWTANWMLWVCSKFPLLGNLFFNKTRYNDHGS